MLCSIGIFAAAYEFPPYGTLLNDQCQSTTGYDVQGNYWEGYWVHWYEYADGSGGAYSSYVDNDNGCWYPNGFVTNYDGGLNPQSVHWYAYDYVSNVVDEGDFIYQSTTSITTADGNGGFSTSGATNNAVAGETISSGSFYDSMNDVTVPYAIFYDGSGGYYQVYY